MLRAISIALRVITVVAVLCALGVRSQHRTPASSAHSNDGPVRLANWVMAVHADDWDMPVHDEETIRKTFTLAGDHRSLEIDNVLGSVEVTGADGDQVQVVVHKELRAESKEKLEEARKRIALNMTQDGNSLRLYVDDPSRWQDNSFWGFRDDHGFCGKLNFEVQVPRDIRLQLKTVSGGVRVRDVTGDFSVHSVNGGIAMENMAGSGTARTVNGALSVKFRENPRESSEFGSVNGGVELSFARNLNADFRMRTFHGSIESDFAMNPENPEPPEIQHEGLKTIYRARQTDGGRVGAGGPEIRVQTLNGAIRIRENHE